MKRIFSIILAVAMVVGLSVQGFADEALLDTVTNGLIDKGDGITYFGPLITSEISEDAKDFMRSFFAVFTGSEKTDDYLYIVLSSNGSNLSFLRTPVKVSFITPASGYSDAGKSFISIPRVSILDSSNYKSVDFVDFGLVRFAYHSSTSSYTCINSQSYPYLITNECNVFKTSVSQSYCYFSPISHGMYSSTYFILWTNDKDYNSMHDDSYHYGTFKYPERYSATEQSYLEDLTCTFPVGLGFVDDDGLLESVTPDPEPEPEDPNNGADSDGDSENSGGADDGSDSRAAEDRLRPNARSI